MEKGLKKEVRWEWKMRILPVGGEVRKKKGVKNGKEVNDRTAWEGEWLSVCVSENERGEREGKSTHLVWGAAIFIIRRIQVAKLSRECITDRWAQSAGCLTLFTFRVLEHERMPPKTATKQLLVASEQTIDKTDKREHWETKFKYEKSSLSAPRSSGITKF